MDVENAIQHFKNVLFK